MQKLYLSKSSILAFKTCKRQFKHRYLENKNPSKELISKHISFGQSIHKALAEFNMITIHSHRTLENLHNLLRKNWIRNGFDSIEEERDFGHRALDMLTQYYNAPQDMSKKTFIIEKMLYKELSNDVVLCGKVDKAFLTARDTLEILDYKTGQSVSPIDPLQLSIYLMLVKSSIDRYPDEVSFYYLANNKKIVKIVDEDYICESIALIDEIYREIKGEESYKCRPTEYCRTTCSYFDICDEANSQERIVLNSLNLENQSLKFNSLF